MKIFYTVFCVCLFLSSCVNVTSVDYDTLIYDVNTNAYQAIAFSSDNQKIAFATYTVVVIYDIVLQKEICQLRLPSEPEAVSFASNNELLATADYEGEIVIWDSSNCKFIRQLQSGGEWNYAQVGLSFGNDDAHLLSWGSYGVKVWDIKDGVNLLSIDSNRAAAISPTSLRIAVGRKNKIDIIDLSNGKSHSEVDANDSIYFYYLFSPDGKVLYGLDYFRMMRAWNADTGKEIKFFNNYECFDLEANCMGDLELRFSISKDGTRLITYGESGEIDVYNLSTWDLLMTIDDSEKPIRDIAISPNGLILLIFDKITSCAP
jgi:WD40 repeat protein